MQDTETKKIVGFLRSELQTAQDVLALQQKDNYRYQEHVKILDGEIDALRELLEDKQRTINNLRNTIISKDDRIKELEDLLYENKVERAAYKTFERQNMLLLQELKETKLKMEEMEVEVKYVRDLKEDRADYNEEKMKMVAEMDIVLNGYKYDYPDSFK